MHETFRWIRISPSPATFVLQKKFMEKFFCQCGKGRHICYHISFLPPSPTFPPSPLPGPPTTTMCDVLPAIGEETPPSSPDDAGDNSKLEQLMISMLEERDKLMEKLRESQEAYTESTKKLGEVETDNKVLLRQLQALMPQVRY